MPTSGETTRTVTAGDLINQAARELGAISAGEDLTDEEMDDGLFRLNNLLSSWSVEGNLFREASGTLTVDTGGAATLPDGLRDIAGVRTAVGTLRLPLAAYSRSEFKDIPNPDQTGARPIVYYWSQQRDGDQIYVWPKPASGTFTLYLDYSRAPEMVESPDQEIDLPNEWLEAAQFALAARMVGMFGTTRLDPGTVVNVQNNAAALYARLLDADRPDAITMTER